MTNGKDKFTKVIIDALAKRVNCICSNPNCRNYTTGPNMDEKKATILGEAAHIAARSPGGARYDPNMTSEERKSITNAIWLCRNCAKLIDNDEKRFPVRLIKAWKKHTENEIAKKIKITEENIQSSILLEDNYTLIQIGHDIVFVGEWQSSENNIWKFQVYDFYYGNQNSLKEYINKFETIDKEQKFIVVESLCAGRTISCSPSWTSNNSLFYVSFPVNPVSGKYYPRTSDIDLAIGEDFDLVFENGNLKTVEGNKAYLQSIKLRLNTMTGEWLLQDSKSHALKYCYDNFENSEKIERLLRLEIVRLSSIIEQDKEASFGFIDSIYKLKVTHKDSENKIVTILIELLFTDGSEEETEFTLEAGLFKEEYRY